MRCLLLLDGEMNQIESSPENEDPLLATIRLSVAKSYSNSDHIFAIEITRQNVHRLIVWGEWLEFDLWNIYDEFIRAEKRDSKVYLLIETNRFTLIYATSHVAKTFRIIHHERFVKQFQPVQNSAQASQFTRKFEFTEVEKI